VAASLAPHYLIRRPGGIAGAAAPATATPHPVWVLTPAPGNAALLSAATPNLTVSFGNVVSFNDVGHTQMLVQVAGVPGYNDATFVVDLLKQDPPPTRGVINFFATTPVVLQSVTGGSAISTGAVTLCWRVFGVANAVLICSDPNVPGQTFDYVDQASYMSGALVHDGSITLPLPAFGASHPLLFTLQGFDASGGILNSLGFAVYVDVRCFVDSYDGSVYTAAAIGRQLWMTQNVRRSFSNMQRGAGFYTSGELARPELQPAAPWRLPTLGDWQALAALTKATPPLDVKALFNPAFDGWWAPRDAQPSQTNTAYYWLANSFSGTNQTGYAFFDGVDAGPSVPGKGTNQMGLDYAMPLRWVRDL
jgi:uncharacterized protein (TIGR02145 family)